MQMFSGLSFLVPWEKTCLKQSKHKHDGPCAAGNFHNSCDPTLCGNTGLRDGLHAANRDSLLHNLHSLLQQNTNEHE